MFGLLCRPLLVGKGCIQGCLGIGYYLLLDSYLLLKLGYLFCEVVDHKLGGHLIGTEISGIIGVKVAADLRQLLDGGLSRCDNFLLVVYKGLYIYKTGFIGNEYPIIIIVTIIVKVKVISILI